MGRAPHDTLSGQSRNQPLAALLVEARWSPRALAQELNRTFGRGTVAATTPYHWRDGGGVPRPPLPAQTAEVLSRRLGRLISTADLWPETFAQDDDTAGGTTWSASSGLEGPWSLAATLEVADDWLRGGVVDRRTFLQVSGAALAEAVSPYLRLASQSPSLSPTTSAKDPLIDQIRSSVPQLQVLDDQQGGGAGLDYVGAQVKALLVVLRHGRHSDAALRELLIAVAELTQLAGWKAVDAAQPGLAQRYLFTGLRAARDAGYRSMEAHILADLAFQAASEGDALNGVALGEAACQVAARSTASVKAAVQSRLAFAYAAGGRVEDCERTWLDAQETLTNRGLAADPEWMYYLTPNHLDCQAGYSMVLAASRTAESQGPSRKLLSKGESLLRTGAWDWPIDDPSQRRALYEASWLALSYTRHGKLDDAAEVARSTLPRLDAVRSPRSVALLSQVATNMRRRQRNRSIADVLPDLEASLRRAG